MLQVIRERLSGPAVWVVVGLITVPFAFFGIETFRTSGGDPTVAKVGSQKITESQLQRAYENRVRQLQEMMGENFKSDMIDPVKFREGVFNEMVQETVLREHARDSGYSASDAAVLKTLETIPSFQKDGKFNKDAYSQALSAQGMNPSSFERQLRDGMAQDQVREAVLNSAFVTPAEAAAEWRLAKQERGFSFVSFKVAELENGISVSDEDISKYFAANSGKYNAPERLKVQYLQLSLDDLPPAAAPEKALLKTLYDADTASFSSPEERKASHILISFGADKAAALKKAEMVKAKISAGGDFAALAKEFSEDPGSKDAGGDLGEVRKGQMTPKFEEALFGMKAGEVSAPVETEFGYHLIKLTSLKPASTKAFEDESVQAQLLASYRKKDAETRFKDMSEKLEQLAFENSASLEPAAKALNLDVKMSDWFNRKEGSGIAANAAVQQAAFTSEVLTGGENSKPITLGPTKLVVLRKAEYEAPRPLKLEEVKAAIRVDLKTQQARAKALAAADALLKEAAQPKAVFTELAAASGASVTSPGTVKRDAEGVDKEVLKAAFKLPRPAASEITYGKTVLANGDVAVIALSTVRDGTATPADPAFLTLAGQRKEAVAGVEFSGFKSLIEKTLGVSKKSLPAPEAPAQEAPAK